MAEMRKVEEGSAFPEKRKLDQPNSTNKALEEVKQVKEDDGFDSKKRHKLEFPAENEKYIITVAEENVESKVGEEGYKGDENNGNKDVHLKVESEIVDKGKRIAAVDKGKAILIEESEEEGEEKEDNSNSDDNDEYDYDSSDDSDSDFSDGLGGDSEYDLAD